ncbi:ABC transporter ATP-binding protein [Oceanobacillus sojae]|uniref:Putative ABC transporter ATP-binding protein YhcH n=1 Tax=Oceanobacillus sojae TaxID=582851 RepID=A0A511ZJH1_9BACI|nr:ABC transporter ATP-binding protein [Oceanobacillus sojae]GEN87577.1 putative ABC transporter ATP-binding protein YhcH [Oceanobacillus sojae]
MNQQPIVQFKHTTKIIGRKTIVNDLNFDVLAGEVFGFLGPNGAGKTTTIRMMVGLIKISRGDILINGHSIASQFEQAIRHVGGIVENPDLYKYLTGYQNLKHYARMDSGISKKRINEIVEHVGLKESIHNKVSSYSLGMRQRLGIAQALLHRPSLLILDEPTNGLDPAGIRKLRNNLKELAHQEGVAVFVSSHLLSEMQLMCDKIAVLQKGKLVSIENVQAFISKDSISRVYLEVEASQTELTKMLIADLNKTAIAGNGPNELWIQMNKDEVPELNKLLLDNGIRVLSIHVQERTLEDKFLEMMGEEK